MNVLDLFSGIGGFSLGLERAGMRTVAFCEIDAACQRVLAKHWPDIPCFDDVRTLTAERLWSFSRLRKIDVICGGFPCQDISTAGLGAGIGGERSGLWSEYARIIGEVRPKYVIVENVAALLNRGLDVVLRDLAALGYDAEWHCIPASAVGASHQRDRIWIVAYPSRVGWPLFAAAFGGLHQKERRPEIATGGRNSLASSRVRRPISPPRVVGGVDEIPDRMDRVRALGNTVIPDIPEIIGRAIMKASGPPPDR